MKIQPLHSSSLPAYSTDPKARARLAAALGLAASLGLAACQDDPLSSDPQGGSLAVTDSLSASTSSSSATAGMPEYSSSSSQDTLTPITEPLSGDIAWVDTATTVDSVSEDTVSVDTLIIEPLAGVIMQPVYPYPQSSSSAPSSSSAVPGSSSATAGVAALPDEE